MWTDETIQGVPHGVDPRQSKDTGIFATPVEGIVAGKCFQGYTTAFLRDDEGYASRWYDKENSEDSVHAYYFFTPTNNDNDIYVTVESYYSEIIPGHCKEKEKAFKDINYPITG